MKHDPSFNTGPVRQTDRVPGTNAEPHQDRGASNWSTRRLSGSRSSASAAAVSLLRARGFSEAEAASLAALGLGLAPVRSGCAVHELDRLYFLRWLVDQGRLRS